MTLTEAYERRLAAFHEPTVEEFYSPGQPRAKDGKWTKGPTTGKMWSGVSAHPKRRVAPTNKVTFPIEADTYENSKEARFRFARGVYETDLGGGYASHVHVVRETLHGIEVQGSITKNHRVVGHFERSIQIGDNSKRLIVGHDGLHLEPAHQGSGVADRFNMHAVAEYQKMGVDHIGMLAGETVGGYAWARQGFRYAGADRKAFLHKALDSAQSAIRNKPVLAPYRKQVQKEIYALRKAIEADEDVQPIHIASLGEKYARHTAKDDHGNTYTTWPGKSALLGTHWSAAYYFDANNAVTAAASSLAHADLRPAFRNETDMAAEVLEEFFNPNHDPKDGRFTSGKYTSGFQHVSTSENAGHIMRGGFSLGAPAWDRSFGNGVYLSHEGDAKSTKFYARQGGRDWRDSQIVHGTVALDKPMRISGESHHALRSDMAAQLGGKDTVVKMAGDLYEHNAEIIRKVYREEFRHENPEAFDKLDLKHPEEAFMWDFSSEAGHRVTERLKEELRGGVQYPEENRQYRTLAENYDKVMAKPYGSDQWENFSEPFGNLVKRAGYDGLVIDTKRWGGVGGNQIVVFDPTKIKVAGARPYAKSGKAITAALGYALAWHELEHTHTSGGIEFACHDPSCRPPTSGGTGGSLKGKTMTEIGEVDIHGAVARFGSGEENSGMVKHLGSLAVAKEITDRERADIERDLGYEVKDAGLMSTEPFAAAVYAATSNMGTVPRTTVGISVQLEAVNMRFSGDDHGDYKIRDKVSAAILRYEHEYETDPAFGSHLKRERDALSREIEDITGISVASGFVSYIHQQWANSAHSPESIAMQLVAAGQHNLTAAKASIKAHVGAKDLASARALIKKAPDAMVAISNATYRLTQRTLAKHGITEVEVYRGVKMSAIRAKKIIAQPSPLSSWTTDEFTAFDFSINGSMFKARIPASQVYSLANLSGTGALNEREVIVLGNPITASAYEIPGVTASADEPDLPVVEIDAEDFDWIKKNAVRASAEEFYNKNHSPTDGRFTSGGGGANAVRIPAGSLLHRGSVESAMHVSNDGESGPGIYLTNDKSLAEQYASAKRSHGPSSAGAAVHTYRATRALHILNRDTEAGENEFRELQRDPATGRRLSGPEAIARLKAAGYDGVQFLSGGQYEREITVHDPGGLELHTPTFKVITAAQARGDSRPVSHEEFQRLAGIGQKQLDAFETNSSPISGLNRNFDRVKREAYDEVRKPWGGATIDSHTGQALPQGANAYAITVKGKGGKTVSVPENATAEEFSAAMDRARTQFSSILQREGHHLGVFHDDENHRIDIDPVLVVHSSRDVETIGAASHSVGGAYNFRDGLGYFPPHVDTSSTATNKRDEYVRTYD